MTLIDKAEALAPCPFCGSTDLYFPHGTDPAVIECSGCGARSGVPDEQTEAEAIAAWSRRALPARVVGVRPLVWVKEADDRHYARTPFGAYEVWDDFWRATWQRRIHSDDPFAAAQADYEARILAALAPTDGEAK